MTVVMADDRIGGARRGAVVSTASFNTAAARSPPFFRSFSVLALALRRPSRTIVIGKVVTTTVIDDVDDDTIVFER